MVYLTADLLNMDELQRIAVDDVDDVNINNRLINIIVYIVNDIQPEEVFDRNKPTRNKNYYEITIPSYSLDDFREHFRMRRVTMNTLVQTVAYHMRQMRQPIVALEKKVLLTIWLLAKPESFLACSDRFGVSRSTAHYIFSEIVRVIGNMLEEYIVWPNRFECQTNAEVFEQKSGGIPNVVGAIDGCHIFIKQPIRNAYDYYNRYQSNAVILQAVCDTRRKFLNISVGHPGGMHDARVFRRSTLYQHIIDDNNPLIKPQEHLIGDCAYPLLQELLTSFRNTGHLTPQQINYNNRISRIRSVIERSFALLKGKWRRLKYLDMSNMILINQVITTCCILHNFILQNEEIEFEDVILNDVEDGIPHMEIYERRRHALGEIKRNEIVDILNH